MKKYLLVLIIIGCASCSDSDNDLEKKYVVEEVQKKLAEHEELLTREELLNRLRFSEMEVQTRPADRTPKSLEKTFPSDPKEHFIMSVDQESFWVSRFNTIGQAKEVDRAFDDGFRFGNWHFAGQITVETTNRIVKALNSDTAQ